MKKSHITIIYELILLICGVFVFRSLWTLMDSIDFFNLYTVHIALFIVGVTGSIIAYNKLAQK